MISLRIQSIRDLTERQLCCGCGACTYISPDEIHMVDTLEYGRRPLLLDEPARDPRSEEAMQVCPGIHLEHTFDAKDPGLNHELLNGWGPVYEVWEGYAADAAIRLGGSSGGAASALALFAIERGGMHGVLHIAARADIPYLNETVLSRSRDELLARTGSRYAPASPCDGLQLIEDAPAPCVFIGKPCDVAAVQKARKARPKLDARVGLTIGFFCAGVPTTRATLELLRRVGVDDPSGLISLRYRGNGWPGRWTARYQTATGAIEERSLSYEESWGFLTNDKQWRCHICPDHTGEFADIAVGDPWYRPVQPGDPGRSLIVPRTRKGLDILRAAAAAGYVVLERQDTTMLPRSQPNLLKGRGAVWGRLLMLRLLRVPVPRFPGMRMARFWWSELNWRQRLQSTAGTLRRVARRGLRMSHPVTPWSLASSSRSAPREPPCAPPDANIAARSTKAIPVSGRE